MITVLPQIQKLFRTKQHRRINEVVPVGTTLLIGVRRTQNASCFIDLRLKEGIFLTLWLNREGRWVRKKAVYDLELSPKDAEWDLTKPMADRILAHLNRGVTPVRPLVLIAQGG